MLWWVQDKSGHRRGPLTASQITRLISMGSIDILANVIEEGGSVWSCMASTVSLTDELAREQSRGDGTEHDSEPRISLSSVPPTESVPCCDTACPIGTGCSVIYIWDRKWKMYLTYDEYVQVCRDDGLIDGLPDIPLPTSSEQVQELLSEVDRSRLVIPRRELARNNKTQEVSSSDDEPLSDPEKEAKRQRKRAYRERKKLKRDAGLWVKSKTNPNVYISGLPLDISMEELEGIFKRAGQIKADPQTGALRIRLYGNGDALITYMRQESVQLAISLFNESEIRPGFVISVQQADFSESTNNTTANLSTDQLRELAQINREKRKRLVDFQRKERALKSAWDVADYGIGSTHRPVVVFTNCFDPRQTEPDYDYIESEIEKFCASVPGEIKKITSIRNSIDGYVCVRFSDPKDAEACIARMQPIGESDLGEPTAYIVHRKVSAFIHDGRDLSSRLYIPSESTEQEQQEEQTLAWESFLEDEVESDDEDIQIRTE